MSFDDDNKNRLYEITSKYGDDYGQNGTVKIKSFFTTGRYDFGKKRADQSSSYASESLVGKCG